MVGDFNTNDVTMELNEDKDHKDTDVEDVLSKFKLTGRYYMKVFAFTIFATLTNELYFFNYILGAPHVDHRCHYNVCNENEYFIANLRSLKTDIKCNRYSIISSNESMCSIENLNLSNAMQCNEWVYDDPRSFVGEFDLGCQDWKRVLLGTLHNIGYMFGLLIVGLLSDKIGRKKAILFTGIIGGILGFARSITYSYWVYVFLEMLEAIIGDTGLSTFTYAIEMATKENRVLFNSILQVTYGIGDIVLAIIAYLVSYWRHYLRVIYIPAILFFLYWFFMDESVRWLLSTGRKEEAIRVLKKAAESDKVHLDDEILNRLQCKNDTSNISLLNLLKITIKSRILLLRFLGCIWMWITCSFTNHTFMINSVTLYGNRFLNYGLTGAMYIAPSLLLISILSKFKRKRPLALSFILTGIVCVAHTMIPPAHTWTSLIMFLLGTFVSSFSFPIVYLYTSEIFPTYTRNTMHALCSSIGRIGSILAPQTQLLIKIWPGFPALLIGVLSVVAGIISVMMPDTADDSLPDNVDQAKSIGAKFEIKDRKYGESKW